MQAWACAVRQIKVPLLQVIETICLDEKWNPGCAYYGIWSHSDAGRLIIYIQREKYIGLIGYNWGTNQGARVQLCWWASPTIWTTREHDVRFLGRLLSNYSVVRCSCGEKTLAPKRPRLGLIECLKSCPGVTLTCVWGLRRFVPEPSVHTIKVHAVEPLLSFLRRTWN